MSDMNFQRMITIMTLTALVQLVIDIITIRQWRRFVVQKGWNGWLWKSSVVISMVLFLSGLLTIIPRVQTGILDGFAYAAWVASIAWYISRLPLALVLFGALPFQGIVFLFQKLRRSQVSDSHPGATPDQNRTAQAEQEPVVNSRRDFLQNVAWLGASTPFILVADGMARGTYDYEIRHQRIPIKSLSPALEGVKIAQISDIHSGSFPNSKAIQEIVRLIQGERPDLIVMTGDFVNFRVSEMAITAPTLEKLRAPLGVYACLGNHDHYENDAAVQELVRTLSRSSQVLVNQNHTIMVDGSPLQIAGTDNTGLRQKFARLNKALEGLAPDEMTILLAHDPSFWDLEVNGKVPVNLMLSGHTHGGQVALHLLGVNVAPARVAYKQYDGLYREGSQYLFVNRGVGVVGPPIRLGVRPEISILHLQRSSPDDGLS